MKVYSNLNGDNSKINASEIAYKDNDNNIDTLNNILDNSTKYVSKTFTNVSCSRNSTTNLATITLPKGMWVVTGYFYYSGNNLRYYTTLTSTFGIEVSTSCYDNSGIVAGNITTIITNNNDEEFNVTLTLWPTDKDITVGGNIKAIKYL